jgi:hypothetical protein
MSKDECWHCKHKRHRGGECPRCVCIVERWEVDTDEMYWFRLRYLHGSIWWVPGRGGQFMIVKRALPYQGHEGSVVLDRVDGDERHWTRLEIDPLDLMPWED